LGGFFTFYSCDGKAEYSGVVQKLYFYGNGDHFLGFVDEHKAKKSIYLDQKSLLTL